MNRADRSELTTDAVARGRNRPGCPALLGAWIIVATVAFGQTQGQTFRYRDPGVAQTGFTIEAPVATFGSTTSDGLSQTDTGWGPATVAAVGRTRVEASPIKHVPPFRLDPLALPERRLPTVPGSGQPTPAVGKSPGRHGVVIASVGGALMAAGILLAATADDKVSIGFSNRVGSLSVEAGDGRKWGGIGLAGAGGVLVWYGLSRRK